MWAVEADGNRADADSVANGSLDVRASVLSKLRRLETTVAFEQRFSVWHRWNDRSRIRDLKRPGVYVLALSSVALEGIPFSWLSDIIYVGMTNSVAGLAGRLQQFEDTVRDRRLNHGGADRVRGKYRFSDLANKLYVAVACVRCDATTNAPADLRGMGRVVKLEYDCLAEFVECHYRLPEFNDKKNSLKHSLTKGRKGAK